MNILAEREDSAYRLSFDLGHFVPVLKFDTGAKYTVISAGMLSDALTEHDIERMKAYCEAHHKCKERFISASGDSFYGYAASYHDVKIGNAILPNFNFYMVFENKRDIALLGFDFIDKCVFSHLSESDILITGFNESNYEVVDEFLESDELIAFIDSQGIRNTL